jgi:hypothetical protein
MKIGLLLRDLVKEELARLELEKKIRLAVEAAVLDEIRDSVRRLAPVVLAELIGRVPEKAGVAERDGMDDREESEVAGGASVSPPAGHDRAGERKNGTVPAPGGLKENSLTGRYVYGVAEGDIPLSLGKTGLEGSEVYTVVYGGLAAIVHDCKPEPYQSDDEEVVKNWLAAHQEVLEAAGEKFQNLIPIGFDTIFYDEEECEPGETVRKWLVKESEQLKVIMDRIRGRQEYGVQVSWEPEVIGGRLAEDDPELREMKEGLRSASKGSAYLIRQKLDKALAGTIEKEADRCFRTFFSSISRLCGDVRVEKVKKPEGGRHMLMNLSCLVERDKVQALGEVLDEIERQEGFSVRFTGPWPPYSFVNLSVQTTADG